MEWAEEGAVTLMNITPVSSPMGPREEALLETFFAALGHLSFDKAKEMMVIRGSWYLATQSTAKGASAYQGKKRGQGVTQ